MDKLILGLFKFKIYGLVKKILIALLTIFAVLLFVYLILPTPGKPPSLPDSLESTEPGDTVQISRVSAYFSQHERDSVVKYYQEKFNEIPSLGIKIPSYRLNHPPQLAHEKIRGEILSSYFEEVVHPLRGSLFINGWEPEVFLRGNQGAISQQAMIIDGTKYSSKATLRPFYSHLWPRLVSYFGILVSVLILYLISKRIFSRE